MIPKSHSILLASILLLTGCTNAYSNSKEILAESSLPILESESANSIKEIETKTEIEIKIKAEPKTKKEGSQKSLSQEITKSTFHIEATNPQTTYAETDNTMEESESIREKTERELKEHNPIDDYLKELEMD